MVVCDYYGSLPVASASALSINNNDLGAQRNDTWLQLVLIQTAQAFFIFNQKGEVSIPLLRRGIQNAS
jgi:hypothetical protein